MPKRNQKKGNKKDKKKGTAANYVTRTTAIRKLQISLPLFRRICILKGIYPREPKRKVFGKNKTYYFTKDILFLLHDPLLPSFRQIAAYKKKIVKARAKKEFEKLERLRKHKPRYRLDHIIRERFPTFVDALRDLDDALSHVHLFASFPPTSNKIKKGEIHKAKRLAKEFQYFVMKTNSLRKVFVSIKGIYYQAEIQGQVITWLTPFEFPQEIPQDVDFKIMRSFFNFYETLLGFVNYKLYTSIGLHYPPELDVTKEREGAILDSLRVKSNQENTLTISKNENKKSQPESLDKKTNSKNALKSLKQKLKNLEKNGNEHEKNVDEDEENGNDQSESIEETIDDPEVSQFENPHSKLFAGLYFFLSREVPKSSLEFIIRSFGGKVTWVPENETDHSITHQIMDRPSQKHIYMDRTYVQPQWIFDSINTGLLLPTEEYLPGATLPPHLSPFVDDYAKGYVPAYREKLDAIVEEAAKEGKLIIPPSRKSGETGKVIVLPAEDEEEEIESQYQKELEAEQAGASFSPQKDQENEVAKTTKKQAPKKKSKAQKKLEEEEREKEMRSQMLSKKKKRMYDHIVKIQKNKLEANKKLLKKRKKIEEEQSQTTGPKKNKRD